MYIKVVTPSSKTYVKFQITRRREQENLIVINVIGACAKFKRNVVAGYAYAMAVYMCLWCT